MADIRPDTKAAVTTLAGTETFFLPAAAGDKTITAANVKKYILGTGVDIGGTGTGDIITTDGTQTLTNKTLTAPNVNEAVALTATSSELNVLDGIPPTLTATEIGYLDGVTSAIQTQINALAPKFAEIYIAGGATAQTVPKTTWTALTFSAAGGANGEASTGMTADKANNKITVSTDGTYRLTYQITFQSAQDALTHQFSVYRDGSIIANSACQVYIITKNLSHTVSVSFFYKEGAQPKDYQLRYYHNHSTDNDITISSANFTIQRVSN